MSLLILSILIIFLGASQLWLGRSVWFRNDKQKLFKYSFIFSIAIIFFSLIFQSFEQYWVWAGNELAKNLLPPYQSPNYFTFYVFTRFFAPYLISLGAALIFLFSAKILNKKSGERFFHPEEVYLGASAIFLSSHPGWLFYVIFLLIVYLFIHICSLFAVRSSEFRVSLYWLWIPTAIFVILLMNWIKTLPLWGLLKI
ncbi:MAG: hypothetical protein WC461_02370 [Candidatus Paceibacterota bacterium]